MREAAPRRLGLIVNPYAGRGGPLARHGSDDMEPAGPPAPAVRSRTLRTLHRIAKRADQLGIPLQIHPAPGIMGAELATTVGLRTADLLAPDGASTAEATRRCAVAAARLPVDLLLFAGGDGTARDVTGATGTTIPVLGIPAGVKMHSGVFGATSESTGDAAIEFLVAPRPEHLDRAEVLDVDEAARRSGAAGVSLYGEALVPHAPQSVLAAKCTAPTADQARLAAACRAVAKEIEGEALTLIGPGTTTARITEALGLAGSLLGVDAVCEGRLVGRDLDEASLLALMEADARPIALVLGVVGGQGMLLGRGNQQLSAQALRHVPRTSITVLASRDKLLNLRPCRLRVDTGDPALDTRLHGHLPVRVAPHERVIMEVGA